MAVGGLYVLRFTTENATLTRKFIVE